MKRLLLPLIAALASPNPVNAENNNSISIFKYKISLRNNFFTFFLLFKE